MEVNEKIEFLCKQHPKWKYAEIKSSTGTYATILKDGISDSTDLCEKILIFFSSWDKDIFTVIFKTDYNSSKGVTHKFDTREVPIINAEVIPNSDFSVPQISVERMEELTNKMVADKMETIAFNLERKQFTEVKSQFESDAGKVGIIIKQIVNTFMPNMLGGVNLASVQGETMKEPAQETQTNATGRDMNKDYQAIEMLKQDIDSETLFRFAKAVRDQPALVDMLRMQMDAADAQKQKPNV